MSTNLEIEFKNMLDENEYHELLNYFSIHEEQICAPARRPAVPAHWSAGQADSREGVIP